MLLLLKIGSCGRKGLIKAFLLPALLLMSMSGIARASNTGIDLSGNNVAVNVQATGAYSVIAKNQSWTFLGTLGTQLADLAKATGTDNVGTFQEATFTYQNKTYGGSIRVYTDSISLVKFTVQTLSASSTSLGTYFPDFSVVPAGLFIHGYNGWTNMPQWTGKNIGMWSPGIFYDNNANTCIISPASNFMDAYMKFTTGIQCGLQSWPNGKYGIAKGYSHSVIMVFGKGINKTFDIWGNALTTIQHKKRPSFDMDRGLSHIGFWTDQQSPYWYNLNGYANYDDLLTVIKKKYDSLKIRLGYIQLDSYWYVKDPNNWKNRPGTYLYQPVPTLFPKGIGDLHNRLGVPFITHNRWIGGNVSGDIKSPYRDQYAMSNGVSIDSLFWNKIIGDIASWGVKTYEQDWLDTNATPSHILGDGGKFMDEMARATNANNLTMEYCMPTERHYLQASKYDNVTTIRTCSDRFEDPKDWEPHMFNSRLAASVGAYPWVDNFQSNELGNFILCSLSGGMVGVADTFSRIADSQRLTNILKAVRRDGVIVKPDVPLVPSDNTYIRKQSGNTTITGFTYTQYQNKKIVYVFDWAHGTSGYKSGFSPAEFGLAGSVYAYNYIAKTGIVIDAAKPVTDAVANWNYYIVSPIGVTGMALIGDVGKFITCSKKRIPSIVESDGSLAVSVAFGSYDSLSPDQKAIIAGYALQAPVVTAIDGGIISSQTYDKSTGLFQFDFNPGKQQNGEMIKTIKIVNPAVATQYFGTRKTVNEKFSLKVYDKVNCKRISYNLAGSVLMNVKIQIFDAAGKLMRTIVDNRQKGGSYLVDFDGRDEVGRFLTSGYYFCGLQVASTNKKLIYSAKHSLLLLK